MSAAMLTGGCHCGAVRFAAPGPGRNALHCFCRDCQLTAGAPVVSWVTVASAGLEVTGETRLYVSSERASRRFCPACGSALFFVANKSPEWTDVAVACLDDPDAAVPATNHFTRSRAAFMKGFDADLPSQERS